MMMNDPDLEKTTEFCKMFDKFFDCLNVSSLALGRRSRNAFKAPYCDISNSKCLIF